MKCPSRPRVSLCANYAVLFSPVLLAARASRRSPVSPSEFDLYQVFRRGRDWGGDSCFLQRTTSFSHVRGDAFQIFCCFAFEALLLVAGIQAVTFPGVAVELLGGAAMSANRASTVIRTVVVRVARTGALTLRRVISVTLSLFAGRRRRRGRGLRAANVPRAPAIVGGRVRNRVQCRSHCVCACVERALSAGHRSAAVRRPSLETRLKCHSSHWQSVAEL